MTTLLSSVSGATLTAAVVVIASLGVSYLSKLSQRRYELQVEKIRAELSSERMRLDAGVHEPHARATSQLDPASATALADQYHARSLAQSQRSFTFSLIAATIGFVVIVGAVLMIGFSGGDKTAAALVQILAAAVIEAVAGLFFTLSNKSRTLLIDFFDKLREDRQFEEALMLARALPKTPIKDRLHVALAIHLAKADQAVLNSVISASDAEAAVASSASANGELRRFEGTAAGSRPGANADSEGAAALPGLEPTEYAEGVPQ
ncbi:MULTISPECIES: TRADD-N-associated membrane domain-containing protein [Nocardia]|uniref:TRADD-N-associated membrane domain-containing protein n=1 Tax=Nocardia TaxID=1817 RepID=UPI0024557BEB|nr:MULTISPECIES: hypothetical protein [Nocardia]